MQAQQIVANHILLHEAANAVHPHPTFSEMIGETLLKADGRPLPTPMEHKAQHHAQDDRRDEHAAAQPRQRLVLFVGEREDLLQLAKSRSRA